MGQESVVMIGALLTTMVGTKTISEWAYGRMMKLAKEDYTLERLGWPKKRQTRFEILAQLTIGSFVMITCVLLKKKLLAELSSYAFMLLMDILIIAAVVVPGLIADSTQIDPSVHGKLTHLSTRN